MKKLIRKIQTFYIRKELEIRAIDHSRRATELLKQYNYVAYMSGYPNLAREIKKKYEYHLAFARRLRSLSEKLKNGKIL